MSCGKEADSLLHEDCRCNLSNERLGYWPSPFNDRLETMFQSQQTIRRLYFCSVIVGWLGILCIWHATAGILIADYYEWTIPPPIWILLGATLVSQSSGVVYKWKHLVIAHRFMETTMECVVVLFALRMIVFGMQKYHGLSAPASSDVYMMQHYITFTMLFGAWASCKPTTLLLSLGPNLLCVLTSPHIDQSSISIIITGVVLTLMFGYGIIMQARQSFLDQVRYDTRFQAKLAPTEGPQVYTNEVHSIGAGSGSGSGSGQHDANEVQGTGTGQHVADWTVGVTQSGVVSAPFQVQIPSSDSFEDIIIDEEDFGHDVPEIDNMGSDPKSSPSESYGLYLDPTENAQTQESESSAPTSEPTTDSAPTPEPTTMNLDASWGPAPKTKQSESSEPTLEPTTMNLDAPWGPAPKTKQSELSATMLESKTMNHDPSRGPAPKRKRASVPSAAPPATVQAPGFAEPPAAPGSDVSQALLDFLHQREAVLALCTEMSCDMQPILMNITHDAVCLLRIAHPDKHSLRAANTRFLELMLVMGRGDRKAGYEQLLLEMGQGLTRGSMHKELLVDVGNRQRLQLECTSKLTRCGSQVVLAISTRPEAETAQPHQRQSVESQLCASCKKPVKTSVRYDSNWRQFDPHAAKVKPKKCAS